MMAAVVWASAVRKCRPPAWLSSPTASAALRAAPDLGVGPIETHRDELLGFAARHMAGKVVDQRVVS